MVAEAGPPDVKVSIINLHQMHHFAEYFSGNNAYAWLTVSYNPPKSEAVGYLGWTSN